MVEFKLIDNIKDVTNELFSNVIIYIIAEPGAMGFPRLMEFVAESGECFYLVYGNEKGEIPYSIIKSSFRALQDCFWNGPSDDEDADDTEIVIYPSGNNTIASTKVSTGWRLSVILIITRVICQEPFRRHVIMLVYSISKTVIFRAVFSYPLPSLIKRCSACRRSGC